jgi:hypothetical protein
LGLYSRQIAIEVIGEVKSPKQHIYCQLMNHGFIRLRAYQSWAAHGSWWWLLWHRKLFRQGYALANLLHNMHRSILEPEFGPNDLSFINHAIPAYLQQVGGDIESPMASLLVAFYDAVPEPLRGQLTWHPSAELRRKAETGYTHGP